MKFSTKSIDNATLRQNVNGQQGIFRGKPGSKPEVLKPFADNYVKKKKDMEGKPTIRISLVINQLQNSEAINRGLTPWR